MFISSLTENQIIASILTFAVILMLWLVDSLSRTMGPTMGAIFSYLSVFEHLNDFLTGVISTSHIIFYVSLTLVGLFLTYRSLDSLRWRG
jgi:ABC-2 type transport system permease protein